MDFLGLPQLPDDIVEYRVYVNESVDDLSQFCAQCFSQLSYRIDGYIWQRGSFTLRPCSSNATRPSHLIGRTNFGGNTDDEWFIVHLLLELSKCFTDLVISVSDTDGQFLLIEAADELPDWLEPSRSANRVFLHRGELHIVPREIQSGSATISVSRPTVSDGVGIVCKYFAQTRASDAVQKLVLRRVLKFDCTFMGQKRACGIARFPSKWKTNIHKARVYLPASLAKILEHQPGLVAAGVRAFADKGTDNLIVPKSFTYFRPGTRVMSLVKFTRPLYAQLTSAPVIVGGGYSLPNKKESDYKAHELGVKLVYAFEMLCARASGCAGKVGSCFNEKDPRWHAFRQHLTSAGYFEGEDEGSSKHDELMSRARAFYTNQLDDDDELHTDDRFAHRIQVYYNVCFTSLTEGRQVLEALNGVKVDVEKMRQLDDSWLEISPAQVDALLGSMPADSTPSADLAAMADKMKDIMSALGDAQMPPMSPPSKEDEMGEGGEIGSGHFMRNMQKLFDFDALDMGANSGHSCDSMDAYGSSSSDDSDAMPGRKVRAANNHNNKPPVSAKPTQIGPSTQLPPSAAGRTAAPTANGTAQHTADPAAAKSGSKKRLVAARDRRRAGGPLDSDDSSDAVDDDIGM